MMLIGSCHNLRLNAILENWVDWVLHPKWFFSYKSMMPNSRFFKNYGYTVPGAMKGKLGIVSITYGGPMISYWNFSFFDNIPFISYIILQSKCRNCKTNIAFRYFLVELLTALCFLGIFYLYGPRFLIVLDFGGCSRTLASQ